GFTALVVIEIVDDNAYTQPQEAVELAHPFRVALGQIVIDGDHVDAIPGERVEINRKSGDQRFTFTGLHFRDGAAVQNDAADELHVKMAHVQDALADLAGHGKSFGKDLIQYLLAGLQALSFVLNG